MGKAISIKSAGKKLLFEMLRYVSI